MLSRRRNCNREESEFLPGREPEPSRPAQIAMIVGIARITGRLARRPRLKSSLGKLRNLNMIRLQEAPGGMVNGGHGNLITHLRLQQA